jgi:glutamate-1-semialdehyde 2,1-aminomutase
MSELAPSGPVYQAGTLSGNPLATAAGLAVLRAPARPAVYDELEARAARLEAGLAPFGTVQRVGSMLTLFDRPVRNYDDARACDTDRYAALFRHLLDARHLRRAVAVRGDVRLARALRRRRRRHGGGRR